MLAWLNHFAAHSLNDSQRVALAFARREGQLVHADYRRLNPGLDSSEITRQLSDLVRQGLLQQHGTRRWAHYTLTDEAQEPAEQERPSAVTVELESLPVEPTDKAVEPGPRPIELGRRATEAQVRRALLTLCLPEPLTSPTLAKRLGRNRTYLLNRYVSVMVAEGLLERVGNVTDPLVRYQTAPAGRQWLATESG